MTEAAQKYHDRLADLLLGRHLNRLSEEQENEILDSMDDLWWAMTAAERDDVNQGQRDNTAVAPDRTDQVDRQVEDRATQMPRKAA